MFFVKLMDRRGVVTFAHPIPSGQVEPVGRYIWELSTNMDDSETIRQAFGLALTGRVEGIEVEATPGVVLASTLSPGPGNSAAVVAQAIQIDSLARKLSPQERRVLELIPTKTTKEIAGALDLSVSTIETFRARAGRKVGLRGSALIGWAVRNLNGVRPICGEG